MGLYVQVDYRGDWWGEDPLTETRHETTGDLFRSLAGRDHRWPWEALGRCTGKVYVDERIPWEEVADCIGTGNALEESLPGACEECGRNPALEEAPMGEDCHALARPTRTRQVGWVFVARNPEPVNRGDTQPTGLREAWVTVYDAPPTVIRTPHYTRFGG